MGWYGQSEPTPTVPTPAAPVNTPGITAKEAVVLKNPDQELTKRKYVINTVNNQTAVNMERLPDVIADLKGFAEGSPVKVTYYKENYSETDVKGKPDDNEGGLHGVHKSVLKIHGMELRLTSSLEYEHDTTENATKLSGEAFTYPGFIPENGDMFIYEISVGKFGLFNVNEIPTPMSIHGSTYYKIRFSLIEYMSPEREAEINKGVVDEAWFDKTRFLAEPGALLRHDEYVEMKFLTKQRMKMIHYHRSKFLDETLMYSYIRPDGVYDPYVVDFLLRTLDFGECGSLATQLYDLAPLKSMSVWSALIDENIPLEGVPLTTILDVYRLGSKSVMTNSLINRQYIYFKKSDKSLQDYFDELIGDDDDDGEEGVIPPDPSIPDVPDTTDADCLIGDLLLHIHDHYAECPTKDCFLPKAESSIDSGGGMSMVLIGDNGHTELMTKFLLKREIDVNLLHDCIKNIWKASDMEQFYKLPIYMFLADRALKYIHNGAGIWD